MTGMPTTSWVIAAVLVANQALACCCAAVTEKVIEKQPSSDSHACCKSSESQPASQAPVSHDPASGGEGCSHCGSGSVKVAPAADAMLALQLLASQWMPMLSVEAWPGDIADHISGFSGVYGCTGPPVARTLRAQLCLFLI